MSMHSLTTRRQVLGQILICSGCCCGHTEKGKPPVPIEWLKKSWKEAGLMKSIQLTISGCLGPCDLVNVVSILTPQDQIWLGGITEHSQFEELLKWAKESAQIGYLLDLPLLFQNHVFDRFKV